MPSPSLRLLRAASFFARVLGISHLVAASAFAQTQSGGVRAARAKQANIDVDGVGDEAIWNEATRVGGFIQRNPVENAAPSESTSVRVVADDDSLYFLIEAHDSKPEEIRGLLTQRDLYSPSDWVEVWLNPQNDRQTGYQFMVNARGVQLDARFSLAGSSQDVNWHAVWQSATTVHERGWTAELRIPLSELRYDKSATTWGLQVQRILGRENEVSCLSATPKGTTRPLHYMTTLTGLTALPTAGGLHLRPYGLLGVEQQGPDTSLRVRSGGDLRLNLSDAATLQGTVLPDFGQVEQDPSQLNLTAFEIFQNERRQYFLDGRENLTFPLGFNNFFKEQLYYSRRIGERPRLTYDIDGDDFEDYPTQSRILGSAKVVGRSKSGLNYSALSAVTARERADFETDGETGTATVAVPTGYNVARLRKEVQGGDGYVGAAATFVHRALNEETEKELVKQAAVGAGDFDLRFGDIGVRGQFVGSSIHGTKEAIDAVQTSATNNRARTDALHLDYDPEATSLTGWSAALNAGIFDGSPWRADWGGRIRTSGLNTNDLGFLRRSDQQVFQARLGYRFDEPTRFTRFMDVTGSGWIDKTFGPEVVGAGGSIHSNIQLRDNAWAWIGGIKSVPVLDTALLRGGPAFLRPGHVGSWWGYHSDQRRNWDLRINGGFNLGGDKSWTQAYLGLRGSLRPTSALSLSVEPSFNTSLDDRQYVDTLSEDGVDSYILGRLDQKTFALTLRANWAIALGLTLRVYAMPFLSAGTYERFYQVTDPRASSYEDRREETSYGGDDQFLNSQLRSTIVLRWDYAPGAAAYLVWTHNQGEWHNRHGRVVLNRDIGDLLGSEATDVAMLKVDYFFSL